MPHNSPTDAALATAAPPSYVGGASASLPVAELDPGLLATEVLGQSGRFREAQAAFAQLLRETAKQVDTPHRRSLVIGAAQRALAIAQGRSDPHSGLRSVGAAVQTALEHPAWRMTQHRLAGHLVRTVDFKLHEHQEEEALRLFELARRLSPLELEQNLRFARLALKMQRRTLDAARLYVELLESRTAAEGEQSQVLALLRDILRVDLEQPDPSQLPESHALSERLWNLLAIPWSAANLAVIALRSGKVGDALATLERVKTDAEADADTQVALAFVAYIGRRWDDAVAWLNAVEQNAIRPVAPWNRLVRPLHALIRVNQFLFAETPPADWQTQLATHVATLEQRPPAPEYQADLAWVLGTGMSLLGRHADALNTFERAPVEWLAWRFVDAEFESRLMTGQRERIAARLSLWRNDPRVPPALVALFESRLATSQGKLPEAAAALAAARVALRPQDEVDLHVVCQILEQQLALSNPRSEISLAGETSRAPGCASLVVMAWRDRGRALELIHRGVFEEAQQLLDTDRQAIAPPRELAHAHATLLGLRGEDDQRVGQLFRQLFEQPGASPQNRLAWPLWLSGQPDRQADVLSALNELSSALPESLEIALVRYEVDRRQAAESAAQPATLPGQTTPISPVEAPADWHGESRWTTTPQFSLFRPWHDRLPQPEWAQELPLSPHRLADMLHAADLLLASEQTQTAVAVLDHMESLLGARARILTDQLARGLRTAALQHFRRSRFPEACELHQRVAALRQSSGDPADLEFAVDVAEALTHFEATPPDAVLEVLANWLAAWQGEPADLDQTPVGQALQRFLFVNDFAPTDMTAVERRRRWSERLATITPAWRWPRRNLARAAIRSADWVLALEHLRRIDEPSGADAFLRGRALWQMQNWASAEEAFAEAALAADSPPEAQTWRAVAAAAATLARPVVQSPPLSAVEADGLLDALQQPANRDLQELVRLWRAAVLLAADRGKESAALLAAQPLAPEFLEPGRLLWGLALVQAGQTAQALALWDAGDNLAEANLREQAVRLWMRLRQAPRADRAPAMRALAELRRRGVRHLAFDLCEAFHFVSQDRLAEARPLLDAGPEARLVAGDELLLRPLEMFLDAERRALLARVLLAQGDLAGARQHLADLRGPKTCVQAGELVRAAVAAAADRSHAAGILAELCKQAPGCIEAQARLAIVLVHLQRVTEARKVLQALQALDPGHPLGLLAKAGIAEAEDKRAEADRLLAEVWNVEPPCAEGREHALAAAMCGRLSEEDDRFDDAEEWYDRSHSAAPLWPVSLRRLALVRALRLTAPESLEQAAQTLANARALLPSDPALTLAAANVAAQRGLWPDASEDLTQLFAGAEFARWPAELQSDALTWMAEVHGAAGQFGAAAAALERLLEVGRNDAAIAIRLDEFRLLHAQSLILLRPVPPHALAEAQEAADKVLASQPEHAVATLVSLLCRVIRGERESDSARALAGRLLHLTFPAGGAEVLARLLGFLCNDAKEPADLEQFAQFAAAGTARNLSLPIALLLANQRCDPRPLIAHGKVLLDDSKGSADLPFLPDDLVRLAMLEEIRAGRDATALEISERWCNSPRSAEVLLLRSQLLARKAAAALRAEELVQSRDLLIAAVSAIRLPHTNARGVHG